MRISDWSSDVCSSDLLYPMYGLTEAFRSTYLEPSLVDSHPDSMGTAILFAEILVMRPDGSPAADDEPGELVHAGPLVVKGYWRDPDRKGTRLKPSTNAQIVCRLLLEKTKHTRQNQ